MEFLNNLSGAPKAVGPYSQAVKVGELLFLAGQIGIDPTTGKIVEGGMKAQLEQVLKNIEAVLTGAGTSKDNIAMSTVFLAEISDGPILNEEYGEWVNKKNPPARQTVAVKSLPMGALVEISVIAKC